MSRGRRGSGEREKRKKKIYGVDWCVLEVGVPREKKKKIGVVCVSLPVGGVCHGKKRRGVWVSDRVWA